MSFKCPHCGSALEVEKCVDLTKAQQAGSEKGDLASGIVKATVDAIEKQVEDAPDKKTAMNSLASLNALANGDLGEEGSGLAAGWGGAMLGALKAKKEEGNQQGAYDPDELAQMDPEQVDKEAVANTLQGMIHGALNKGE